nr:hypothetical protein Iba_chr15bCG9400 [Ipomoea batatas]
MARKMWTIKEKCWNHATIYLPQLCPNTTTPFSVQNPRGRSEDERTSSSRTNKNSGEQKLPQDVADRKPSGKGGSLRYVTGITSAKCKTAARSSSQCRRRDHSISRRPPYFTASHRVNLVMTSICRNLKWPPKNKTSKNGERQDATFKILFRWIRRLVFNAEKK